MVTLIKTFYNKYLYLTRENAIDLSQKIKTVINLIRFNASLAIKNFSSNTCEQ